MGRLLLYRLCLTVSQGFRARLAPETEFCGDFAHGQLFRSSGPSLTRPAAAAAEPQSDVAAAIGSDERRMHVRAYNYWCSLLDGRDYPSIEDLEPGNIQDFGPHSVLLDFTEGSDNPATPYIGTAIREECGLGDDIKTIADVPSRSLLSRLTDHYMQIIANRAPVGFEAEFVNQRGHSICYRGILMPFSSDGDTIDFIYGVINWKDVGEAAETAAGDPRRASAARAGNGRGRGGGRGARPLDWSDLVEPLDRAAPPPRRTSSGKTGRLATDAPTDEAEVEPAIELDADAGLADRLWAARESAEVCKQADGRSRAALYRALAMAYDFAVAAKRVPDDYAEILDDAGVKAQARAPMTPIVKLVFGVDYDKTRLTEFAAALELCRARECRFRRLPGLPRCCRGRAQGPRRRRAQGAPARQAASRTRPSRQGRASRSAAARARPACRPTRNSRWS